jgi:hypothetical protein
VYNYLDNCVNKTWLIHNATNGNPNASITLQWSAADENSNFNRTSCYVGHYTGGGWDADSANTASGSGPFTLTRTGLTSFSPFSIGDNISPLPVKLTAFDAKLEKDKVLLNWTTSCEINNDHFEIERSTDGVNFTSLGNRKGAGTTNAIQEYAYTDNRLPANILYYRLKQIDYNGKYEYSQVRSLKTKANPVTVSVSPNPFSSITRLEYHGNSGVLNLQLCNAQGLPMESWAINSENGTIEIGNEVDAGVYYLVISGNDTREIIKLVKAM